MMYTVVKWKHSLPDEPCVIYSEIDDERWERRKVDIYPDGRWGYADEREEVGGSGLGEVPMPALEQIAVDEQFEPSEIDRQEFERIWEARLKAPIWTPWPESS